MKGPTASVVGCALLVAFAGCSGAQSDGDDDGLQDVIEIEGWAVTIVLVGGEEETRLATSSPDKRDTDRDEVGDAEERILRWDASDADTDDDGLLDGSDVVLAEGTPLARSFREQEIIFTVDESGELRFQGEKPLKTNPLRQDSDAPYPDGLSDGDEVVGFDLILMGEAVHVSTDPFSYDTDGDFLSDAEELSYGTHPDDADTDGDGFGDDKDLNPVGNMRLELRYKTIRFLRDKDAEPLKAADLYIDAYPPGMPAAHSRDISASESGDTDISTLSPGALDIPDGGADAREGDFNVTVSVFAYDRDPGSPVLLDLSSTTTGQIQLDVDFDVRTEAHVLRGTDDAKSGDVVSEGPDARIVFVLRVL